MKSTFNFLFLLLACMTISTKTHGASFQQKNDQTKLIKSVKQQEKIYLHLDRFKYQVGDTIWFKTYLVESTANKPAKPDQIVYVDIVDSKNNIISNKTIKTENGGGQGSLILPINKNEGTYVIRGYTNYMRNFGDSAFFKKNIQIGSKKASIPTLSTNESSISDKPDLQFFPEGGTILTNIVNRIGFKGIDQNGMGLHVSGTIVDGNQNFITTFNSTHIGMGLVSFIPKKGKRYVAQIEHNGTRYTYDLPLPVNAGAMLNVFERGYQYQAEVHSDSPLNLNGYKLIVHQGNKEILSAKLDRMGNKVVVNIPKHMLGFGIARFTLYNAEQVPLCERLIFNEANGLTNDLIIQTDKKEYGKRDFVALDLELAKKFNQNSIANISVSVADITLSPNKAINDDIKTYLLLSSELKGKIENAGYYFNATDPARKKNLDLLMMTQGWRGFMYEPDIAAPSELRFPLETDFSLKGKVTSAFARSKPVVAEVALTYSNNKELVQDIAITDAKGEFQFNDLDFSDSTAVLIRASKPSKKTKTIRKPNPSYYIQLDSLQPPAVASNIYFERKPEEGNIFIKTSTYDGKPFDYDEKRLIKLKETVVSAEKPKKETRFERKRRSAIYLRASQTIDFKEIRKTSYGNVFMRLQGRVPGYAYSTATGEIALYGSGAAYLNRPLVLIDGVASDIEAALSIPVAEIDFVDIIKGGGTAIYGMRGGHGVLSIFTLDGREQYDAPDESGENGVGTLKYTDPGYGYSRKFYHPKYPAEEKQSKNPDYRKTLYWNPNADMSGDNKTKLSFYTADISTTYKIIVQGLTSEGQPIYSTQIFEVK